MRSYRSFHTLAYVELAVLVCGGISGCAAAWTDKDGTCHAVGLATCTVHRADGVRLAGDIVEMSTLGIVFTANGQTRSKSLGFGYSHTTSASFADNAVALGPFNHVKDSTTQPKRNTP